MQSNSSGNDTFWNKELTDNILTRYITVLQFLTFTGLLNTTKLNFISTIALVNGQYSVAR
jgi:hypothetical protein